MRETDEQRKSPEEQAQLRSVKLSALRDEIAAGLASGPSEVLDMQEIKAAAREAKSSGHNHKTLS